MERLERGVEVTYANLGRRHTPFRPELVRGTNAATTDYLTRLTYLLDLMVVLRMDAVKNLEAGRPPTQYELVFPVVRARLEALQPPAAFARTQELVLRALADQQRYFEEWARRPGLPVDLEHNAVRRAHWHLVQAYDLLLANLPPQDTLVLEALYDPFHALDFLGYLPDGSR